MRLSVRHETSYRYSAPVRLGPHLLRLQPRAAGLRILRERIIVMPEPATRVERLDRYGNRVTELGFDGTTELLHLESSFAVEIAPVPPVRDPGLPTLPWVGAAEDGMAPDRTGPALDAAVQAFASALAAEAGGEALPFLAALSRALFTRLERRIRPQGAAQTAAETLALGRGACRDLTVLFMAACRSQGIVARFVSGYQAKAETPDGLRHLHAWPEVLLPGLGWRGYDPTHGTSVGNGHVALCAAPDQAATMPVEGSYYGVGVTSTLAFRVEVTPG